MEHVKAFFIHLFTIITAFFYKLFHIDNKNKKKTTINEETITPETKKIDIPNIDTSLPDEPNTFNNPHNETGEEAPNAVILELPKLKYDQIKLDKSIKKQFLITAEVIDKVIEEALEELEEHKKINFKVKDANKETKEKIKEFKEKVIPKINHSIEVEKPQTKEELKNVVTEVVKEQNKLTPLFPKKEEIISIKKEEPKLEPKKEEIKIDFNKDKKEDVAISIKKETKEPYVVATVLKDAPLNVKEIKEVKKEERLATTKEETKEEIKEQSIKKPVQMVKLDDYTPKPAENIKQVASIAALTTVKAVDTILKPVPKVEIKKEIKEDKKEEPVVVPPIKELDVPELKTTPDKIKQAVEEPELDVIKEDLTYIDNKIEDKKEEIIKTEQELPKEKIKTESPISFVDDNIIEEISDRITKITNTASEEMKKEEIEDKNYPGVELEIDKILEDINGTKEKYKDTMPEVQKRKLEAQEAKLEQTKYSLDTQKKIDINNERKHLDELIQENEKHNLKKEIERLKFNHQIELNNELINKVEDLNNKTQEQVERIEKVLIKRKMKEAYKTVTITSMLAFPFIRSKYFFYFTTGMFLKTFFLQLHGVLRHKTEPLSLPDINSLQNGEDALNEAINLTNDNMELLNDLTQESLSKYPDLEYDLEYMKYVNGLKEKLNINEKRLNKKRQMIDKLLHRSKKDIKILKKTKNEEQERMAA